MLGTCHLEQKSSRHWSVIFKCRHLCRFNSISRVYAPSSFIGIPLSGRDVAIDLVAISQHLGLPCKPFTRRKLDILLARSPATVGTCCFNILPGTRFNFKQETIQTFSSIFNYFDVLQISSEEKDIACIFFLLPPTPLIFYFISCKLTLF